MSDCSGGCGVNNVRLLVHQQRSSAGNERGTERGSPSGRIAGEGIGSNDGFAGRGYKNDGIAIVGEGRLRVEVRGGCYAHDCGGEAGWIDTRVELRVVAHGGGTNDPELTGVVDCRLQLRVRGAHFELKTHVHNFGVVLHSVVDSAQ